MGRTSFSQDTFTTSPKLCSDGQCDQAPAAVSIPNKHVPDHSNRPSWAEFKKLLHLAGPLVWQNLFGYSLSIIAAAFVGHLNDPVALSSTVLAGSLYNVSGYSIIVGLSAGMETLCGQAYGAKNYKMLGIVLQRSVLICWVACLPVLLLWYHTPWILDRLHQAPEIVAGASRYLMIISPTLFVSSLSSSIYRYLLAQREVKPGTICTVITACLCPGYNYYFIYRLGLGMEGAAIAFLLSNSTYTVTLLLYLIWRDSRLHGTPKQTWPGISLDCFRGWGQYLEYGIPAAAMICCEWWVFELVIIFAGALPDIADAAVSTMGICFHITAWCFMLPMSVGSAANTRIANELGAGHANSAQGVFKTGLIMVMCTQAFLVGSTYVMKGIVVKLFTQAPEVVDMVGRTVPVVAATVLGDGLNALLSSVLRGCGRQSWGAALNLIGYWCVGCPLAVLCGFYLKMNTVGFWLGLAAASNLQVIIQLVAICSIRWEREVERARALVGKDGEGSEHGEEDGEGLSAPLLANASCNPQDIERQI